jgi:Cd2+/Zn2+-exporting ATPase
MSTQPTENTRDKDTPRCLARSVVEVLSEEPTLEAVTIDRARQTISVATLGRADVPALTEKVSDSFERAQAVSEKNRCMLLEGAGECLRCSQPLSEADRKRISINHDHEVTTIARVTCPTAPKFWRWRDIPFPKVVQRDVGFFDHADEVDEWKGQLVAAVLCGAFGLTGYALHHQSSLSIPFYLLAYLAGSWFTAQEVWERLRERAIDVHFLMLSVAAGSAAIGAWGEGAMLLFLFSFSGALEHFALGRTQREIRSLFKEAPKVATVLDENGAEREVQVEKLAPGMRLLVKPGSQFAVDAEITRGKTASDESNLTGEAAPVEKGIGDMVLAGTMNLWGAVEATVKRPASQSSLQKIIRLIQDAQHQKAPAQQFTDKFSSYYTYAVLALSLVMFFVWWLLRGFHPFTNGDVEESAFYHAMTLLVVASPCALVLSIPSAVLAAIASAARHGILFRGGAAVEKLAGVDTVALDKTGTLTTGELRVTQVESFPPGREQEIATLAYSLERLSTHPLARAITRYGKQQALPVATLDHFESITGQGLRATHEGHEVSLGRRDWSAFDAHRDAIGRVSATGSGISEIWVGKDGVLGRILLRDDIRSQSRAVIQDLREEGLRTVVLTGDRHAAGEYLKTELGLDDVRAELKPDEKLAAIQRLTEEKHLVAMIGDGVNDAPSLAAAHIGVAMGARGADAALEQADVILMHDRLENFLAAFRLSQRARRVIRQNLFISLGTVVVLVTFALLGRIPLTLGVLGHEGSTVVVVMNSLRLLFSSGEKSPVAQES